MAQFETYPGVVNEPLPDAEWTAEIRVFSGRIEFCFSGQDDEYSINNIEMAEDKIEEMTDLPDIWDVVRKQRFTPLHENEPIPLFQRQILAVIAVHGVSEAAFYEQVVEEFCEYAETSSASYAIHAPLRLP